MADGAPRAADVSFDKPAAQKREGKVIKKAPAKPKSERDADAAKAKEAARVAAREKAAAAAAAQVRTRCLFPNFSELPVASTASSRCRTTSTPSTWSSESLRVS